MKIATFQSGQGADIVLIHGWTHDHHSMQPIIDLLSPHYKVTAVDLPGCGESEWGESINSVNDAADTVLSSLPENAIYIGWSWGGAVCQSIAGRFPERVKQLVLIGSVPKFIEGPDWPAFPQPGFAAAFGEHLNNESAFKNLIFDMYTAEFGDQQGCAIHQILVDRIKQHGLIIPLPVQKRGLEIIDAADLRQEFSDITCPIDFIIGSEDGAVPVDWDKIKALNANAKVSFIPGAQHFPFMTHPDEFNKLLMSILQD